jgi:hypothetical protein
MEECIKSLFMFQTSKKKKKEIKNCKPGKAKRKKSHLAPLSMDSCNDTVCLLTLKCLFFKKLAVFLYSYTKFLMFLWQWNIMEFYNYIKKVTIA